MATQVFQLMNGELKEAETNTRPWSRRSKLNNLDCFKKRFQQLYIEEKLPLPQVMAMLRKEGCQATRNMYLERIREWNLHKYQKGKGKSKDEEITILSFQVSRRSSNHSNSPRPSLKLPETLNQPQHFLTILWDSQSFCTSVRLAKGSPAATPSTFSHDLNLGTQLMSEGQTKSGGALVERGFHLLEQSLKVNMHTVIPRLVYCLRYMLHCQLYSLAEIFARYLYQLSSKVFGLDHNHPMIAITRLMFQNWNSIEVLDRGFVLIYDVTVKMVGRYSLMSIARLRDLIKCLSLEQKQTTTEVCQYYEQLIKDCEHISDTRAELAMRVNYGEYLARRGQYFLGVSGLRNTVHLIEEYDRNDKWTQHTLPRARVLLSELIIDRPKYDIGLVDDISTRWERYYQAKDILQKSLDETIQYLGPDHYVTLNVSQSLMDLYTRHGSKLEAQEQSDFMLEQLKDFRLQEKQS